MNVVKNGDGTYTSTPTAAEQKTIAALRLEYNAVVDPITGLPRSPAATDAKVLMVLQESELKIQRQRLLALNAQRRDDAMAAASPANQSAADAAIGFVSWF